MSFIKKVTEKYDEEVCDNFVKFREDSATRGHSKKIFKERCKKSLRLNSFLHRVADIWKKLPENVVNYPDVVPFG